MALASVVLWLFVVNLGIAFGAGLYEHRIVLSTWLVAVSENGPRWHAEVARVSDTGRRFWAFVTTVPLTLLTLANLVFAWGASGEIRAWWLAAALLALADRLLTFGYFIPRMIALMKAPDSSDARAAATRWVRLNHVRCAVVLGAWLASLQAFRLLGPHP